MDMTGIRTSVEITEIAKFVKQKQEYSIVVQALNNRKDSDRDSKPFSLYNTKERSREFQGNLLLIKSGDKVHFVVIKSLSRLLIGKTYD